MDIRAKIGVAGLASHDNF